MIEPSLRPTVPPSPPNSCNEALPEEAMKEDWSDGEKRFSEAIWISSPSTITPCSIRGTTIEVHINPIMEVNVLPWHLAYTLLGNVTLRPSYMLLKSCPSGHILKCRGVASCWRLPTSPPGNSDDARRRLGLAVFHEPRINPQAHGIPL